MQSVDEGYHFSVEDIDQQKSRELDVFHSGLIKCKGHRQTDTLW